MLREKKKYETGKKKKYEIQIIFFLIILGAFVTFLSDQFDFLHLFTATLNRDRDKEQGKKCIGIANFPDRGIDPKQAILDGVLSKKEYFDWVNETYNITSGRQTDKQTGMCLTSYEKLHNPVCLKEQEYKFAIFLGGSQARELGASFARASASADLDKECQPWGNSTDDNAFKIYRGHPDWCGNESETPHKELCPLHQRTRAMLWEDGLANCCKGEFWLSVEWLPKYSTQHLEFVQKLTENCPCKGIVVFAFGVHHLLSHAIPPEGEWSVPFGRALGARKLLNTVVEIANSSQIQFVWASPFYVEPIIMALKPKKPFVADFYHFDTLELWAAQDKKVVQEFPSVLYLPFYEITAKYNGLQCDGMHWSSLYEFVGFECKLFSVVIDVATQFLLGKLCAGKADSITLC